MFPDENHVNLTLTSAVCDSLDFANSSIQWVLKPENSLVWHREVLAWINKYAGVDVGSEEGTSSLPVRG